MQIQVVATLLVMAVAVCSSTACGGFGRLRTALNANSNGLADSLTACVAPLLFTPIKWIPAGQAREFCSQKACVRAVAQLKKFPSCTWHGPVPSGSDANTLAMAQQVMRDCA
ncbi:Splicing factor U2AF 50 kDa subunit [Phytophthora cinnamomi]|uniref:Splicing factor U2AF 50 kDa subunit n=1 Tax=Phytophthora cinnamomi TaxID=4785 RepID=UPI003559EF98|nr:Splicing factor U2AF 50 kDa subunit [Phytophthora cinnamomi]